VALLGVGDLSYRESGDNPLPYLYAYFPMEGNGTRYLT
jgi:hypothetical protein